MLENTNKVWGQNRKFSNNKTGDTCSTHSASKIKGSSFLFLPKKME
jgi:hypothetical protein